MASNLDISRLDKKQGIMMGVIVAMALSAGFYTLYYDPSRKRIVEMRKEIEAKDNKIRNAKIQVTLFRPLQEQVERLDKRLDILRAKTATSGEIISLLKTIENEAQRLDMKVINMSTNVREPPPAKEGDSEEESPEIQTPVFTKFILDINLQSKYDKLEEFLETLQNLETFLVIEKLDISSGEEIYPMLTSNLEINLYNEK